ncbi:kinase-like domain-containing protein [Armillaria novae-zelandiae]|uniref:Kinase-like domain-containing protein n=1 Tax=Armillaria novae-zelandiae TaxID=153914 RepID=A0AA39NSV2_9AGAR|nr:kinase-like domain-containing protein [Armillaria novae-zelandiae]
MHQKNLPKISFQPDPLQVCDLRCRDLWKVGFSPFHAINAINRYGAFFHWINNPPGVLWLELGLPRVPALIATEYCFQFKKDMTATSAVAYYICDRNKGFNNIIGSLLYQLVQQMPSTDISPLLLCHVLHTKNVTILEDLFIQACHEFEKVYVVLDAIDAYHHLPDILTDVLDMIDRLSKIASVLFTTTHSNTDIRARFSNVRRLNASTLTLQSDTCTQDTAVHSSPDLIEEILLSLTNPLYHNYCRFFNLEPEPIPYLQHTAYGWAKDKISEILDRGPPESTNDASGSNFLREIQGVLSGGRDLEHAFRKFIVSTKSWQNIIPLASKNPLMVVNFLQKEIDTRAYVYNEADYRARCIKCLLKVAETYLVVPTSLVVSNIRRDSKHYVNGGAYADIYRGRMRGIDVCLKVLRLFSHGETRRRGDIRKEFCREALVWRNLQHPNVLRFIGVNEDFFYPSFCLISPWMKNGDILSFLRQNPRHNRMQCIREVANGLHYLHSHDPPVVHADIRGANILVTGDFHCCLADFGLAHAVMTRRTESCDSKSGTVRWLAPELLQLDAPSHWHYMPSRDIYAFGCTVVEIFTGRVPFSDIIQEMSVALAVLHHDRRPTRPSYDELPYDSLWSSIEVCWSKDIHKRPSSSSLVEMLNNLDLSEKAPKKKAVSKSARRLIISEYNLQHHKKLGIGRYFRRRKEDRKRSCLSICKQHKHLTRCGIVRKGWRRTV